MQLNINNQINIVDFKEQFLSSLSAQNRKILLVAALAIAGIAALYYFWSKCCFKAKQVEKADDQDQKLKKIPLSTDVLQKEAEAKKAQEEAADIKAQADAAAKKMQEDAAAKKAQEDAAAKKAQEEADAIKAQADAAAKKMQEDAAAKKAQEDAAAKKAQEEAAKKALEEADSKKNLAKTPLEIEAETDPIKQQLLATYTPQMVMALGGLDKMKTIPYLHHWNGELQAAHLTAPVMFAGSSSGPGILFCFLRRNEKDKYRVCVDYIGRSKKGEGWESFSHENEMHLRDPNAIKEGSLDEKHLLDRIKRLMLGQPVGRLQIYKDVILLKPANKDAIRPDDSYLKGDELTAYMELSTLFYERETEVGSTDLYLWDPTKNEDDQWKEFVTAFPNAED